MTTLYRYNGHFSPCESGLSVTRMYTFWILLELRMTEVVLTTGAVSCAKSRKIVTTNKPTPNFLQVRCPFCRPTNSVRAMKGHSETTDQNKYIIAHLWNKKLNYIHRLLVTGLWILPSCSLCRARFLQPHWRLLQSPVHAMHTAG